MRFQHPERHLIHRIGWLRASVLGANDGIVSTASLIVGVAAGADSAHTILLAGTAGLVAGAMSMAAGEYISVSSQSDTEAADLARERTELATQPEAELHELAGIYEARGLSAELAATVAAALTAHDPLAAHARDELGITEVATARPVQAALASASSFALGAALPLAAALLAPAGSVVPVVSLAALVALAVLGAVGARAGGAGPLRAAARVALWGAVAMMATAAIGALVGVAV